MSNIVFLPGDRLSLSAIKYEGLGSQCSDMLDDMESDHKPMLEDFATRWDWYEAVPRQATKNHPWPNAANMTVPVIQTHSDALVARLWGALQRYESMAAVKSKNGAFAKRYAAPIAEFINYGARSEFDTFFSTLDTITEFVVQGEGVMAAGWDDRREFLMTPSALRSLRGNGRALDAKPVTTQRGPVWEYVPRDQIMWWPWGTHIDRAEAIARQFFYTWSEICLAAQMNQWRPEAVAAIEGQEGSESMAAENRRRRRERSGLQADERVPPHDIRQLYVNWPTLQAMGFKDGDIEVSSRNAKGRMEVVRPKDADWKHPRAPLLVTIHRNSKQVLDVRPKPTITRGWDFVDLYFRRRPGASASGVAKKLEMVQRAISVAINQSFDAVTRANVLWAKTSDATLRSKRFAMNEAIFVNNMADFELLNAPKSILPDIALVQLIDAYGQKLSGVNDPLVGRELRSGGHPSPATNFLGLLEESNKLLFPAAATLNRQISRMFEITATLYQQFDTDPDGRVVRALGDEDGARVREWLFPTEDSIAGNAIFNVRALSSLTNPDAEGKRALLVSQVTDNYFAKLLKVVPLLEQPQVGELTKKTILEAIDAFTNAHRHFLEASEVDEVEDFLATFRDDGAASAQQLGRFAGLLRETAGGNGGVQQLGNGRPPGGLGGPEAPGSGLAV